MKQSSDKKPMMVILRGLNASGKTVASKGLLKVIPNAVRLSKADMRAMMHKGMPWTDTNEHVVIKAFNCVLREALDQSKNIIIDDINMNIANLKTYKNIAEEYGYAYDVLDMDVTVENCVRRDALRPNGVGRDTILNMAVKYNVHNNKEPFIIYGLDFVLADTTERTIRSIDDEDNTFYSEVYYDTDLVDLDEVVQPNLNNLLRDFEMGYEIVIVSTRPEKIRKATEKWLQHYCIPYNRLLLRKNDDTRSDHDYKEYMCQNYLEMGMCAGVVDVGKDSLNMWRKYNENVIEAEIERELVVC